VITKTIRAPIRLEFPDGEIFGYECTTKMSSDWRENARYGIHMSMGWVRLPRANRSPNEDTGDQ